MPNDVLKWIENDQSNEKTLSAWISTIDQQSFENKSIALTCRLHPDKSDSPKSVPAIFEFLSYCQVSSASQILVVNNISFNFDKAVEHT